MRTSVLFGFLGLVSFGCGDSPVVAASGGADQGGSGGDVGSGGAAATVGTSGDGGAGAFGGGGSSSGGAANQGGAVALGNPCEEGCETAAQCGFDVCTTLNVDCSAGTFNCPLDCISGRSCDELSFANPTLQACLLGCQAPDGGDGGSNLGVGGGLGFGGGGLGLGGDFGLGGGLPGGPDQFLTECNTCAAVSCGQDYFACITDSDCLTWLQCTAICTDPFCYTLCNFVNLGAQASYEPIYDCLCQSCDSDCALQSNPCNQLP